MDDAEDTVNEGIVDEDTGQAAAVERALVAMRRSQTRRALARMARRGGDQGLDRGVDAGVFGVLDAVEEGARTVTDVAGALAVDQPRASRLVARAVDRGLVRREADQRDGRRALLALTARGRDALAEIHRFRRDMAERAMADWPPADRAAFAALLPRFVTAFTRITTAQAPPPVPGGAHNTGRPAAEG